MIRSGHDDHPSAFGRSSRLADLLAVGVRLSAQAVSLLRDSPTAQLKKAENMVLNAVRIAETLGEMKGAAMKVGQMLGSTRACHLRKSGVLAAAKGGAECLVHCNGHITSELKDFDELFESLEPEAFAAASIGQVHRVQRTAARLPSKSSIPRPTGWSRRTENLEALLKWWAIWYRPSHLGRRSDYSRSSTICRARISAHGGDSRIAEIIDADVVNEATTRRTTMELWMVPPGDAVSGRYYDAFRLRSQKAVSIHVERCSTPLPARDPNFANFAFREDGQMVHRLWLHEGDGDIAIGSKSGRCRYPQRRRPELLRDMGVLRKAAYRCREPWSPYVDLVQDIVRASPPTPSAKTPRSTKSLRVGHVELAGGLISIFPDVVPTGWAVCSET